VGASGDPATRPHRPQVRCGRSAQRAQTPRRSRSRAATGLVTPQRAHGSASSRRRQRAHTPPATDRVNGRSVRRQCTQLGSVSEPAPRATSSVTSRPTTGGAPVLRAARIGGQGGGQRAQHRRTGDHHLQCGLDLWRRQRRVRGQHPGHDLAVAGCGAHGGGNRATRARRGRAGGAEPDASRRAAADVPACGSIRSDRRASSRGCRTTPPGWSD
jgi:hypothetical protein